MRRWIVQQWPQLAIERKLIILQVRECIAEGTTRLNTSPVTAEELVDNPGSTPVVERIDSILKALSEVDPAEIAEIFIG
ncbi:hypothetical protein D187_006662 [Cystobacter fuscus DSM 2262]|uniref:Uncharacterized protein n=1 Tax=Cystobacter fuscus (strain ATCC 25194 / DSM 2262 / NBRC 100088 / M29) TaxID=1242864 RepID=S9Q6E9_CYSF2|nr:hypothetical protein D187_006662 [Cystobacter fuscus DSM 2262]